MQTIRNIAFSMKGYFSFTQQAFQHKHFDDFPMDDDTSSKHVMITGSNSGIGYATAKLIAQRGSHVHMICRDRERGQQAMEQIISESNNDKIHLHIVDVSSPRDILQFAKLYQQQYDRLDVLINNAGALEDKYIQQCSMEKTFALMTMGSFMLTRSLSTLMEKNRGRVIMVSSGGMYTQPLDNDNLQNEKFYNSATDTFDGVSAYAHCKRQQVCLTKRWAHDNKMKYFAMHPGWVDTPGVRTSLPSFYHHLKDRLRSAEQGADTIVYLALLKEEELNKLPNGGFFFDREPVSDHLYGMWTQETDEDLEILYNKCLQLEKTFTVQEEN